MKKLLVILAVVGLLVQPVYAADISLTRVINATVISPSTENSNQTAIEGAVNSLDGDNINTAANLTFTNLTTTGDNILGDGAGDDITINAELISDIIPNADALYDLGSASKSWEDVHTNNLDVDDSTTVNDVTFTGNTIGDIIPNVDSADDLGTALLEFEDAFIETMVISVKATLADGSVMATSGAPTADAQIANKKYVDDNGGIASVVADTTPQLGGDLDMNGKNIDFPTTANISDVLDEDAMGSNSATKLSTQQSIKAYHDNTTSMSALTINDSESNAMVSSISSGAQHAYLAQTDGMVTWLGELDANSEDIIAYVDTDSDPVTGGTKVFQIQDQEAQAAYFSGSFSVAEGEYFEILNTDTDAPLGEVITWRSFGTLSAPVDQN